MAEKGRDSVMDGIPVALPALAYAAKVQKKAGAQGVAWRTLLGVDEDDLAVRLLELVDEARETDADPETELRRRPRLRQAFDARPTGEGSTPRKDAADLSHRRRVVSDDRMAGDTVEGRGWM